MSDKVCITTHQFETLLNLALQNCNKQDSDKIKHQKFHPNILPILQPTPLPSFPRINISPTASDSEKSILSGNKIITKFEDLVDGKKYYIYDNTNKRFILSSAEIWELKLDKSSSTFTLKIDTKFYNKPDNKIDKIPIFLSINNGDFSVDNQNTRDLQYVNLQISTFVVKYPPPWGGNYKNLTLPYEILFIEA